MYIYYNPNPEGRTTGDCIIRAISRVTNKDWERTYLGVCLQGLLLHDMPDMNHVWSEYLYHQGFVRDVVAVVDGDYYDAWDSGNEIPLYYWRKDPSI